MSNYIWYYLKKRFQKKYYIINRSHGGAGFFSNYMWVLGHVIFARKLGYIPIVDMENYPTLYSEEEGVDGEKNAWNYYFENVGEISLKEAYTSGQYILGQDMPLHRYEGKYCKGSYRFPTEKAAQYYFPVIEKNIRIKADLLQEYEKEWKQKVSNKDVIMGVHVRGTDMKNNLGHPMPASVTLYIENVQRMIKEHPEITKVFLATDEWNVKEAFEKRFGAKLLFMTEAFRVWDTGEKKKTGVHETVVENPRLLHKYLLGKEVLKDAYFLYKSDYLICGHSNITNVVLLWKNNGFKEVCCLGDNYEK